MPVERFFMPRGKILPFCDKAAVKCLKMAKNDIFRCNFVWPVNSMYFFTLPTVVFWFVATRKVAYLASFRSLPRVRACVNEKVYFFIIIKYIYKYILYAREKNPQISVTCGR